VAVSSSVRDNLLEGVYDNVVVVLEGYSHSSCKYSKVRGCRYTKLIDSRYKDNRYRYHKNAIINKDISSLVGIVFSLAVRACLSIAGAMRSLYSSPPSYD
jgi:hypothetical protein